MRATEGAAFTGARGQLRWFREDLAGTPNDKTIIAGDINGDAIQIELTGLKTLTAADFSCKTALWTKRISQLAHPG